MTDDPTALSAGELAMAIAGKRLSATEAVSAQLARIEQVNPRVNAIVHVDAERAIATARDLDGRRNSAGPLHGVPVTLKDSHRIAGMPISVGNPDAPATVSRRDGYVAERLRAAGAVLIGKTNVAADLNDFQSDNLVFGRTNNPWDITRTPGGSSGGAAAALAARMTTLEIGSDIAGSIRLPAAFTGVIGLKPSAGMVSARGHVTEPVLHPRSGGIGSLASIGPLARTFPDLELLMTVLAPSASSARCDPASFTIGLLPELPGIPVERSIRAALMDLANTAVRNGIRVDLIDPPMDSREQHRAWVDMHAAASKFGSSWETRHPTAASKRLRARAAWGASLARHGVILMPAAMCVAFAHRPTGAPIDVDGTPVPYWRLGRYTEPLNLTGLPAIVFPIGMDGAGLPIAAQLVGANGQDSWLVASARWLASLVAELPVPT